jgi:hypothetical protein
VPVTCLSQRIDLNLGSVLVLENLVQIDEYIRRLLCRLTLETQLGSNVQSFLFAQPRRKVDGCRDDRLRVLRGDLFDVHASLRGCYEDGTLGGSIVQDRDVVFVHRIPALGKHDL